MARGDSGKKVSRAARAGGKVRSAQQRSFLFPGFIVGVVVIGVLLIFLSLDENEASSEPPLLGDHWHAAYGLYICDQFMPPLQDAVAAPHHLHTHGDGLIHIHPSSSAATGTNADLGIWADTVGLEIDDDSIDPPGDEYDGTEGDDDCSGDDAQVQLAVWEPTGFNQAGQATAWDGEPTIITEDVRSYRPQDNELVTIAFVPSDAEIPQPPSTGALAAPVDEVEPTTPPDETTDTTTGDDTTETTSSPDETTETTTGEETTTTGGSG